MTFLTTTTLISAHGAGITMAVGTRFTLTETGQPDPKADQMSIWHAVVPLLTTRCLYWGCSGGIKGDERGQRGCWALGLHMTNEVSWEPWGFSFGHDMSLLGVI